MQELLLIEDARPCVCQPFISSREAFNETFKIMPAISDEEYAVKAERGCLQVPEEAGWLFNKLKKDMVYLLHESRLFGMAVRLESIDWGKVRSVIPEPATGYQ